MAEKRIFRILDDLSPSDWKLKDLPRKAEGLYNMFLNEWGQLEKRKGYNKYNTTTIGAAHGISGMHRFHKQVATTKKFIVAWNTKWYELAASDPWGATALLSKSGTDFTTTADKDTFFLDFKNHCYGVNGIGFWKYGGTYVRIVGITPPAAPTLNTTINGSLTAGDYLFKYTFVDEDGFESNGGTASSAMTAGADPNDGIKINIAASTDDKVTKRRIYRTSVGGATYYYDGEVANNTGITYDSTISDAEIIVKSELHNDHTVPPTTPHLIEKRRSRIILAEDENTICSKVTDEYFPAELYFPAGNKQKITGLKEQLVTLPVFTDDSLERLTGWDSDNYEFKNAFSNEGCIASRSLANCKNLLVYLAFDGIYYFNGTLGQKLDYKLSKYIMNNINPTYAHLSCGVYYEDKYLLTYPKGSSTVPNETVYYNFNTKTSGVYDLEFSCYSVWDKGGDAYSLKGGSNTEGRVYDVFDGLDDDGSAITCYDDVEGIDLGIPDIYKKWYSIYIKVKTTTGTALRMYYTLDDENEAYVDETLTAGSTEWYQIGLGSSGLRARSLSFRPYVSDKYAIEIHGYGLVYSLEPAKWQK